MMSPQSLTASCGRNAHALALAAHFVHFLRYTIPPDERFVDLNHTKEWTWIPLSSL
jgi:hypothetical protein